MLARQAERRSGPEVRRTLMPHFRPLSRGREDLECRVKIEFDPETGRIQSWVVTESSGDPSFDAAAERAVQEAATLPLPPEKYLQLLAKEGVGFDFRPQ